MQRTLFIIRRQLKSRIAVFLSSLLLLVTMLSAVLLIAAEAEHDCTGDDCPICACIRQCETCLSVLSGGCTGAFSFIAFGTFVIFIAKAAKDTFKSTTLVTQKVRLND